MVILSIEAGISKKFLICIKCIKRFYLKFYLNQYVIHIFFLFFDELIQSFEVFEKTLILTFISLFSSPRIHNEIFLSIFNGIFHNSTKKGANFKVLNLFCFIFAT